MQQGERLESTRHCQVVLLARCHGHVDVLDNDRRHCFIGLDGFLEPLRAHEADQGNDGQNRTCLVVGHTGLGKEPEAVHPQDMNQSVCSFSTLLDEVKSKEEPSLL